MRGFASARSPIAERVAAATPCGSSIPASATRRAAASEAVLTYGSMRTWQAMRVLSPEGCFPFSKKRNGTVLAEGAGILVLEELEHARARGAKIYAEVTGYGATSDGHDMVAPSGSGGERAMRLALSTLPEGRKVGYINLRNFIDTSDPNLRAAFAMFKAQGVTELIVDLRYNGGGLVSMI